MKVHILHNGKTLCGQPAAQALHGTGDRWVGLHGDGFLQIAPADRCDGCAAKRDEALADLARRN